MEIPIIYNLADYYSKIKKRNALSKVLQKDTVIAGNYNIYLKKKE